MKARHGEHASAPPTSPSGAALAPGKRTRTEDGEPPARARDSEHPHVAEREAPVAAAERAADWEADAGLMNAMGLPELASGEEGASVEGKRGRGKKYVPVAVSIPRALSREAFQRRALQQVLGSSEVEVVWSGLAPRYLPSRGPAIVMFEERLLLRARGQVNEARGIASDEHGQVAGAAERAGVFTAQPGSDAKAAVLAEIDRRYHAAVGPIEDVGDIRETSLWRQLRDEALFQQEHLAALPEGIQRVFRLSLQGRALAPRDYEALFRIAQKLALLSSEELRGLTGKLGDVSAFSALELAVDGFFEEREGRARGDAERVAVQNKLLGLEDLYRLYVRASDEQARDQASPLAGPLTAVSQTFGLGGASYEELRPQLERELVRHGFASIAEFRAHVGELERTFEEGAARITLDVLDRYAATLHREAERYRDPAAVHSLYGRLGGFRDSYRTYEANASKVRAREARRSTIESPRPDGADAPAARANAARAAAIASLGELSVEHPIFGEGDLPDAQRLDKERLAKASEGELAPLLQGHLTARLAAVAKARGQLEGNPALIYKLDRLMPLFYAELEIQPGSVHDLILQDKLRTDAMTKLLGGLLLTVVTVALTMVSVGAATPPLIAAGASAAAAGVSVHVAGEELDAYAEDGSLAAAGLMEDPSVSWLAISLAGAGVDLAVAASAVRALAPAARALEATGDVSAFARAVQELRAAQQLDARIAATAERAAQARAAYGAAKRNLTSALAKAYSFPGPLTDPMVARALVQMAVAKVREGAHSLAAFIEELKQARAAAKLAELSPEELVAAKDAWARAEALGPLVSDAAHLEALLARIPDPAVLERLLRVFSSSELVGIASALQEPAKLAVMLDHLGEANTGKLMRQWIEDGDMAKANAFVRRLAAATVGQPKELSALEQGAHILDTNAEVAMSKHANPSRRLEMNEGERARVALIEGLPSNTDFHLSNISLGETDNLLGLKGLPVTTSRDSPEYLALLGKLEDAKVGKPSGFADRALVADAFFARMKGAEVPRLLTSDANVIKKLAKLAGIDPNMVGGYGGLVQRYGNTGFRVTINGRTIVVVPSR